MLRDGLTPGDVAAATIIAADIKSTPESVIAEAKSSGQTIIDVANAHKMHAWPLEIFMGLVYLDYTDDPDQRAAQGRRHDGGRSRQAGIVAHDGGSRRRSDGSSPLSAKGIDVRAIGAHVRKPFRFLLCGDPALIAELRALLLSRARRDTCRSRPRRAWKRSVPIRR